MFFVNFAFTSGDDGMILEVGKYLRHCFYFDCFISGYDIEQEYLFIGGHAALEIKNILQHIPNSQKIENYSHYLKSIQCLFALLKNGIIESEILSSVQQNDCILLPLLTNERDKIYDNDDVIPEYIRDLFHYRCDNTYQMTIDLDDFLRKSQILKIENACINDQKVMIDFDLFAALFPKLTQITINVENTFKFSDNILIYLYQRRHPILKNFGFSENF